MLESICGLCDSGKADIAHVMVVCTLRPYRIIVNALGGTNPVNRSLLLLPLTKEILSAYLICVIHM